jgi:iron complex transport system ATP-binding protein
MLARCLAQDSRIILLDEPLAFLDYPTRIEFLKLLKIISEKNNKLIIYSSHDLGISIDQASAVLAIHNQTLHFFTEPSEFSKDWLFPLPNQN